MGAMSFPSNPPDGYTYEKWYYDAASGEWKLSPISSTTLWSEGDDNKIYYDLGEVGVGTSEPTRDLVIFNSAGPVVQITDQGAGNVNSDGLQLKQLSANSEIMNKEAGNLVLGTNDTAMLTINSNGNAFFTGTVNADTTRISSGGIISASTGSGVKLDTTGILPMDGNATLNNGVNNIGSSSRKWKDAHFSGTVNTGAVTSTGTVTAPTLAIGNWKIELDGNHLVFKYNNNKVAKMETTGKIISKNDVRAFGTP